MNIKFFFAIILLKCSLNQGVFSQELNFKVSVITQGSINSVTNDQVFFKNLEKGIIELMNNTQWGEDVYKDYEKIKGNLQLTITEEAQGVGFRAEIALQTERPVYNSSYITPLLSIIDKSVVFTYSDLQPLLKTTNTFYDNLSSILSYYAYLSIGMDYESFRINGGEPFFLKAQEVISSLSPVYARDEGWGNTSLGKRNRFWLIENILSPRLRQFRQAFYEYHRLALDKMYEDSDKSRAVLLSNLTSIGQANLEYPDSFLLTMFGDVKKNEILDIFKIGDKGQKDKVKAIMNGIDPTKRSFYENNLN
jgi:hypothetical protein